MGRAGRAAASGRLPAHTGGTQADACTSGRREGACLHKRAQHLCKRRLGLRVLHCIHVRHAQPAIVVQVLGQLPVLVCTKLWRRGCRQAQALSLHLGGAAGAAEQMPGWCRSEVPATLGRQG